MTTKGKRIKERHDGSVMNIQNVGSNSSFFGLLKTPRYSNVSSRGIGSRRGYRR